jgi:hypothetical protein
MGTRADFYVKDEWLGSVAWDGYFFHYEREHNLIMNAVSEEQFRKLVAAELANRNDGTIPDRHGWPWPWDDSRTTDYAYVYDNGVVYVYVFGEPQDGAPARDWPDMSNIKQVDYGQRSGLMFITR